jgi:dTDP-4-dehydrorhamnose reductase
VRVDDAEVEAETCFRENARGPEYLAAACAELKLPLVTFSSDLVFDGRKDKPYVEDDPASPLNVYGRSKAEAEARVLEDLPQALIIRTSAFFGPWDRFNFVHAVLETISKGGAFVAADDITISPTYVPDLVNAALDLLIDGEQGIWHLANRGAVTWTEFARLVAHKSGYNAARIVSRASESMGFVARRPLFTPLTSERGAFMPTLEDGMDRFFRDREWNYMQTAAGAR